MENRTGETSVRNLIPTERHKENYDYVDLTDEEVKEALRLGRKEKYHRQKLEEYKRSLSVVHIPKKMDADELRNHVLENFPEINPDLQKVQFEQLIEYFTGPEEKGLMLYGGVGCGKTTLMKIFQGNPKASYALRSCREISELFSRNKKDEGGYDALRPFKNIMNGQRNYFNHDEYGICFDDLGEEKNQKHFGNEANVMEDILLSRYEKCELWSRTHITTNLKVSQIEEIYGMRVRSRMREMFIQIDFSAINDLRK